MIDSQEPPQKLFYAVQWHKVFAWLPVRVDAYKASEVRNGKMSFFVWLENVEWAEIVIDDESGYRVVRRYRLVQS